MLGVKLGLDILVSIRQFLDVNPKTFNMLTNYLINNYLPTCKSKQGQDNASLEVSLIQSNWWKSNALNCILCRKIYRCEYYDDLGHRWEVPGGVTRTAASWAGLWCKHWSYSAAYIMNHPFVALRICTYVYIIWLAAYVKLTTVIESGSPIEITRGALDL